jgi:hypothetical protein
MVLVKVSAPDMVAVMVDPDPTGTLSKYAAVIPSGEVLTLDGECGVIVYVLGELALSTIPVTVREGAKFATMHTTMFPGVGAEAIVTDRVVPLPGVAPPWLCTSVNVGLPLPDKPPPVPPFPPIPAVPPNCAIKRLGSKRIQSMVPKIFIAAPMA